MSGDGSHAGPFAERVLDRRTALGAIGALILVGCAGGGSRSAARRTSTTTASTTAPGAPAGTPACTLTPEETAGPFVEDLHDHPALVRRDVTEGRTGVPLSVTLTVLGVGGACAPLAGYRVDLWQCDREGVYSGFRQPDADTTGQTFLRGIQTTDRDGRVTFATIYPGWYRGRATHIHYQVFLPDGRVATSQLAFPEGVTRAVYASDLYRSRGQADTSNAADSVFGDGTRGELIDLRGAVASEFAGTLTVGVRPA